MVHLLNHLNDGERGLEPDLPWLVLEQFIAALSWLNTPIRKPSQ